MTQRDSSAINSDRLQIKSVVTVFIDWNQWGVEQQNTDGSLILSYLHFGEKRKKEQKSERKKWESFLTRMILLVEYPPPPPQTKKYLQKQTKQETSIQSYKYRKTSV